jgi:GNAT superfamily N-acetyltransferase
MLSDSRTSYEIILMQSIENDGARGVATAKRRLSVSRMPVTPTIATAARSMRDPRIQILSCKSASRFLDLQRKFYEGDPHYIPPLTAIERWRITSLTSSFLRANEVGFFVAHRDRRVVGRISATRNFAHDDYHGDKVGFVGHFEAFDKDAAHALFDHAIEWLRAHGATSVRGPIDLSTNYRCSLLVEGGEEPPVVMMPHNPPEYRDYLESYGFQEVKRLLSFSLKRHSLQLTELKNFVEKVHARNTIRVRPVRAQGFRKDMKLLASLYGRIWARNWGFAPMSEQEFLEETAGLRLVCPRELFQIAFAGDEPIGFVLALPDFNAATRACEGRLFPFGWWKFLREVNRLPRLRLITLGVVPEHRRSGADALLIDAVTKHFLKRGFQECEACWILEDNYAIIRMLKRLGGTVTRRFSIFGLDLGPP